MLAWSAIVFIVVCMHMHIAVFLFQYQVSAFSTWEKELHKIVFDPRYLLLGPEERKQVRLG